MTNYPYSQDSILTLPTVAGSDPEATAINALQSAVLAIEEELGIKPSTPYSDVRVRLDILESRINFGIPPSIPNDGYVKSPLYIFNELQNVILSISDGYGAPTENRLNGSLYLRADGYANNDFYIRRDGYWVPIQTEAFVAAGDLAGNHLSQTVVGIRGKTLNASLASVGATQDGYHLTWNNAGNYWEAQTGFVAASDLAVDSGPFGRTGQRVVRLQNRTLSSVAPGGTTASNGDVLVWNPIDSQWQPQVRAVIFDGYTTRVNLRSNRASQSLIDNTRVGIVNFSSRSFGATTGATGDYSTIVGGDRHTASANYTIVVGGDNNSSTAQYASVVGGLGNVAGGTHSIVLNGTTNSANGNQSVVLDGYTNSVIAANAWIGNGGNNNANALFSMILNGISNIVTAGAQHAAIGLGTNNTIGSTGLYSVIIGGTTNTLSAANGFFGTPSNASTLSDYSFIGTGLGVANTSQRINATSPFASIINGSGNVVSASSGFAFIGGGNVNTVTGLHSTVVNGNGSTANGLHATVLNGNTNSVNAAYGLILDGYTNTVSGSGGLIGDGYTNTVSGEFSSILNGNNNNIAARNSTILNGSLNTIDVASVETTILDGTGNSVVNSISALISGNGNVLNASNNSYIFGTFNTVLSNSTKVFGSMNSVGSGGSFNRIFGNGNVIGATSTQNTLFGATNTLVNSSSHNFISGSSNIADGYGNSAISGATNITNANFSFVQGQYGKSRLFGQQVQASGRFNVGQIGNAQWSRVVLTGNANSGAAIPLLLQDTSPTPATFQDGYSYDMQIRVLVVNTAPIGPNPVVPARFVFDVLAHQEGGTLILDNVNATLITPNTSDDPSGATRTVGWTVSIGTSTNQLTVTVDPELDATNYVRPTGTASNRRAIATIEMREITRL